MELDEQPSSLDTSLGVAAVPTQKWASISEQALKVVKDNNYPVRGTLGERTPYQHPVKSTWASRD